MQVSTRLHIPEDEFLEQLSVCVADVHQHVPCSPSTDAWDSVFPLNVRSFYLRGKSPTVGISSE